jgi:hypothetical protein
LLDELPAFDRPAKERADEKVSKITHMINLSKLRAVIQPYETVERVRLAARSEFMRL